MNSFSISLFLTCLVSSCADLSIDTTSALTVHQFDCLLVNQDVGVVNLRVYDPAGFVDETGIQNMKHAIKAGLYVDVYISPCVSGNCQNNLTKAADQVNAVVNRLNQENLDAFIVISIERGNWSTNQAQNQQFVMDLLNAIPGIGFNNGGIMTSQSAWTSVVGNSFTNASDLADLTWVYWNGKPDFSGFTPFGGWKSAFVHQYAGNVTTNKCAKGIPLEYSVFNNITFAQRNAQMVKKGSARLHKFARN